LSPAWDEKQQWTLATYTVDLFTTLDGFGTGTQAYWDKDGPVCASSEPPPTAKRTRRSCSRTLQEALALRNSTRIAEDALDAVPRLKAESPVPLRCHGITTGASGKNPILAGLPDIDLELVDSQVFDGRVQHLVYAPTLR
jgi:hypothetical protein